MHIMEPNIFLQLYFCHKRVEFDSKSSVSELKFHDITFMYAPPYIHKLLTQVVSGPSSWMLGSILKKCL